MIVAISQPRYLPALNYLQRACGCDAFVILDTVQRQARGWENRNRMLIPDAKWLTIPISSSSRSLIMDTNVSNLSWVQKHKDIIRHYYHTHPFYQELALNSAYELNDPSQSFTEIVEQLLLNAFALIDRKPRFIRASSLIEPGLTISKGPDLLKQICELVGASCYVSGPNGKQYGVEAVFDGSGIELLYHRYTHPSYKQANSTFEPFMGYLDALFCCGQQWLSNILSEPLTLSKN